LATGVLIQTLVIWRLRARPNTSAGLCERSAAGCSLGVQTEGDWQGELVDARRRCRELQRAAAAAESELRTLLRERERLLSRARGLQESLEQEADKRSLAESALADAQAHMETMEANAGIMPVLPVAHRSANVQDRISTVHRRLSEVGQQLSEAAGVGQRREGQAQDRISAVARQLSEVRWQFSDPGDAGQRRAEQAKELEKLRQRASELQSELVKQKADQELQHQSEVSRLQEELFSVSRDKVRLQARCCEAEERAATTTEVADALKLRLQELTAQAGQDAAAKAAMEHCLSRLTADKPEEVTSVPDLVTWEREIRRAYSESLERLAQRRTALEVEAMRRSVEAADRIPLCRICYERDVRCALLPCKHHSFCKQCAGHILRTSRKCPICRREANDIFETFLG